ncbi:M15 family metallopeptidase [Vulcanococcus limneticus]|uniref:M15 family metallopeptidase n=1 Tax=Vulcanococcus limneticus TaxID=2170428 RepID=UPI0036F415A4
MGCHPGSSLRLGSRDNAGRHTLGTAVDVTLVDRRGRELPMPTDADVVSEAAHRDAPGGPGDCAAGARRLSGAMERRGFLSVPMEWWHIGWKDWQSWPVVKGSSV